MATLASINIQVFANATQVRSEFARIASEADRLSKNIQRALAAGKLDTSDLEAYAQRLSRVANAVAQYSANAARSSRGFEQLGGSIGSATREAAKGESVFGTLVQRIQQSSDAARVSVHVFDSMALRFQRVFEMVFEFGIALQAMRMLEGAVGLVGDAIVGLNARVEQSHIFWSTFLKDQEQARLVIEQVQLIAAKTPFYFQDLLGVFQQLAVAGVPLQHLPRVMLDIATAVAAVGGGREEIQRVTLAIQQMVALGMVRAEEMRQLAQAGIPSWQLLAQVLGTDVAGAMKAVEERSVPTLTFLEALHQWASGDLAGLLEAQSRTFSGAIATIVDSIQIMIARGFEPLFDVLRDSNARIAEFVQSDRFVYGWAATVQAAVSVAVSGFSYLRDALASALMDIWSLVSSVGRAIYEALQWINPFAPHSPPLVDQVEEGMDAIANAFEDGLDAVKDAIRNTRAQIRALEAQLRSLQAQQRAFQRQLKKERDLLKEYQDALRSVRDAISDVEDQIRDLRDATLVEELPFLEALKDYDREIKRLRLQKLQLEFAGVPSPFIDVLTNQIEILQKRAEMVELERELQIEPLREELQRAADDALGLNQAISFGEALSQIQQLTQRLVELREQEQYWAQQVASQEQVVAALEDQLDALGETMDALRNAIDELRNQLAMYQNQQDALKVAQDTLKQKTYAVGDAFAALRQRIVDVATTPFTVDTSVFDTLEERARSASERFTQAMRDIEAIVPSVAGKSADEIMRLADELLNAARQGDAFAGSAEELRDRAKDFQYALEDARRALQDQQDVLREYERLLRDVEMALRDTERAIRGLVDVPLAEEQPYLEQLEEFQKQIKQLEYQRIELILAGAPDEQIQAVEEQIRQLQLQAKKVDLEREMKIEPMREQLQQMADDALGTGKALTFQEALQAMQQHIDNYRQLQELQGDLNQKVAEQRDLVDEWQARVDALTRVYEALQRQIDAVKESSSKTKDEANALSQAMEWPKAASDWLEEARQRQEEFRQSVEQTRETILGWFQPWIPLLKTAGDYLGRFVAVALSLLALKGIGKIFMSIVPGAQNLSRLAGSLAGFLGAIASGKSVGAAFAELVGQFKLLTAVVLQIGALASAWGSFVAAVRGNVAAVGSAVSGIGGLFSWLGEAVLGIGRVVLTGFGALPGMISRIQSAWGGISAAFGALWGWLSRLKGVLAPIGAGIQQFGSLWEWLGYVIGKGVIGVYSTALRIIEGGRAVIGGAATVFGALFAAIRSVIGALPTLLGLVGSLLGPFASLATIVGTGFFMGLLRAVDGAFALADAFLGLLGNLRNVGVTINTLILRGFMALSDVLGLLGGILRGVGSGFAGAWSVLVNFGREFAAVYRTAREFFGLSRLGAIIEGLQVAFAGLHIRVAQAFSGMASTVRGFLLTLVSLGRTNIGAVLQAIGRGAGSIGSVFGAARGAIIGFVKDIGLAYQVARQFFGLNVVGAFVEGLAMAFRWAGGFGTKIASLLSTLREFGTVVFGVVGRALGAMVGFFKDIAMAYQFIRGSGMFNLGVFSSVIEAVATAVRWIGGFGVQIGSAISAIRGFFTTIIASSGIATSWFGQLVTGIGSGILSIIRWLGTGVQAVVNFGKDLGLAFQVARGFFQLDIINAFVDAIMTAIRWSGGFGKVLLGTATHAASFLTILADIGRTLLTGVVGAFRTASGVIGPVFSGIRTGIGFVAEGIGLFAKNIPTVVSFVTKFAGVFGELLGFFTRGAGVIAGAATSILSLLNPIRLLTTGFSALRAGILGLLAPIAILKGSILGMFSGFWGLVNLITLVWQAFHDNWFGIRDIFMPVVRDILDGIKQIQDAFSEGGFQAGIQKTVDVLSNLIPKILDAFSQLGKNIWESITSVDWGAVWQSITSGFDAAWQGIQDIGARLLTWLGSVDWAGIATTVMDAIANALAAVGSAAVSLGSTVIGWFTSIDWSAVAQSIADFLTGALAALTGYAERFLTWLKNLISQVDWQGVASSLVDFITGAWSVITSGIGFLVNWLLGIIEQTDWAAIGQAIVDALSTAWSVLTLAADKIADWFRGQFEQVDWSRIAEAVITLLLEAWKGVTTGADMLADWLRSQIDAIDWSGITQTISDKLKSAVSGLRSFALGGELAPGGERGPTNVLGGMDAGPLETVRSKLAEIFAFIEENKGKIQPVLDMLKGTWDAIKDAVSGVAQVLSEQLGPTWNQLKETLSALAPVLGIVAGVIGGALLIAIRLLAEVLSVALPVALNLVFTLINNFLATVEGIAKVVTNVVGLVVAVLTGDWSRAWERAKAIVQAFWDTISSIVSNIWNFIKDTFQRIYDWLVGKSLIPDLVNKVTEWITKLRDMLAGLWDAIKSKVTEIWEGAYNWVNDKVNAIKTTAVNVITEARDKLAGIWDEIKSKVTEIWQSVYDWIDEKVNAVKKTAVNVITEARDKLAGLWDEIKTKANEVWTWLQTTFENTKQSIYDALKWPFEQLRDNVGGILKAAVNGIIGALNVAIRAYNSFGDAVAGALRWVGEKLDIGFLKNVTWNRISEIPAYAKGTDYHPGGLAIVGEEGPELVMLPRGSAVIPLNQGVDAPGWRPLAVGGVIDDAIGAVKGVFDAVSSTLKDWLERGVAAVVSEVFDLFGVDVTGIAGVWADGFRSLIGWVRDALTSLIQRVLDEFKDFLSDQWALPLPPGSYTVSQEFGWTEYALSGAYRGSPHTGIDLAARYGTPIYAAHAGKVVHSGWLGGYGLAVIIDKLDGIITTLYGHMARTAATVGQMVSPGTTIGYVDSTGYSTGDHLHFEVREHGVPVNPRKYLAFAAGGVIREPVLGIGAFSGHGYLFGERGPELVTPLPALHGAERAASTEPIVVQVHFNGPVTIESGDRKQVEQTANDIAYLIAQRLRQKGLR